MSLIRLTPLWDWEGPADDLMGVLASISIPDEVISGFSANPKECISAVSSKAKLRHGGPCANESGQMGIEHVLSIAYYEESGSECYEDSILWCNSGSLIRP